MQKSFVKDHNSQLAKNVKKSLKELGHEIPLGHAYELISKMSGYPNWDTASSAETKLNPLGDSVSSILV